MHISQNVVFDEHNYFFSPFVTSTVTDSSVCALPYPPDISITSAPPYLIYDKCIFHIYLVSIPY